jgi:hypothetical protein
MSRVPGINLAAQEGVSANSANGATVEAGTQSEDKTR